MKIMTAFSICMAILALTGCAASSAVVVGNSRPAIVSSEVKIYLHPPKKYQEIALIDASSKSSWAVTDQGKMDKVIERLKEEAAKVGANGVLLNGTGQMQTGGGAITTFNATNTGSSTYGQAFTVAPAAIHKTGTGIAIFVEEE